MQNQNFELDPIVMQNLKEIKQYALNLGLDATIWGDEKIYIHIEGIFYLNQQPTGNGLPYEITFHKDGSYELDFTIEEWESDEVSDEINLDELISKCLEILKR